MKVLHPGKGLDFKYRISYHNVKRMQATQSSTQQPVSGQFRQRIERKFFLWPQDIHLAYALLRQVCRPDRQYPAGRINSLYFDTADLEQHERSVSGEFYKDKVRIRWYGYSNDQPADVNVFLELKSRQGFASSKRRRKFHISSDALKPKMLNTGIIERSSLNDTIAEFGYFAPKPLRPIIRISYSRYRFVEMSTGMRVALDYDICSTFVAREFGHGERELPLRGAVIEVKGPSMELPRTLQRIKLLNTDWSRFSKYSHCIDAHLEDPGSISRLWPSGKSHDV